jgi:hypothetical protein
VCRFAATHRDCGELWLKMSRELIDELLLGSDDEEENNGDGSLSNRGGAVTHEREGDEIDEIMRLHHLLNDFEDDEKEEIVVTGNDGKTNIEKNDLEENINDLISSLELEDNNRYLSLEQSSTSSTEEKLKQQPNNESKQIEKSLHKAYQDR